MSLSLGEKLRQAREEQGISISEIAEQTRISPHYLKSIENNEFKVLPGGIFNRGFVKSFARYVGLDEAEALQDYATAIGEIEGFEYEIPKVYHPEVLTDDRTILSMVPTIAFAVVILALMTGGILFVVRYFQNSGPVSNQATLTQPSNQAPNANSPNVNAAGTLPAPDGISVELKAVAAEVWVRYSVDGVSRDQKLAPDETVKLDASNAITLSYSKAKLPNLQVAVNGRQIAMSAPQSKGTIELEVNKSNVNDLIQSGQAPGPAPAATATTEPKRSPEFETSRTPRPTPAPTSTLKPSPTPVIVGNRKPSSTPSTRPN